MIASIPSAVLHEGDGRVVTVEVQVANGLPGFTVVGLPDAAVRESRDRARAAFASSGLPWPRRRITVNLAPSGMRKAGAGLDLPIAVGILVASGILASEAVAGRAFLAELGLDGSLRGVQGALVLVEALAGFDTVLADANDVEARFVGKGCRTASSLADVVARCTGRRPWPPPTAATDHRTAAADVPDRAPDVPDRAPDLSDVRGQRLARRALEIAATGGHHLLLVGAPGAGKTMLAVRLCGLLPVLDADTAHEVARIRALSASACSAEPPWRPPERAPHPAVSVATMVGGGGSVARPGEVSLAHGGTLILDELGEFAPNVLDTLRQPLEDGIVRIDHSGRSTERPARFILVATMNPCPCGEGGVPGGCRCTPAARARYARRLSGPLLDRFDLRVPVERLLPTELIGPRDDESTATVAARVAAARRHAGNRGLRVNAELDGVDLDGAAALDAPSAALLERHLAAGHLSARGLHRVRRVARTIADLGGASHVRAEHLTEALFLRGSRALVLGEDAR